MSVFLSIVTPDGGLTTLGYWLFGLAAAALLLLGTTLYHKRNHTISLTTKQLVFSAVAMALAFVTSYIKLIPEMPYGGSVTLFSMLFVCLIGYWYGPTVGIMTGFSYGILQFLQSPYILSPFQVCCDYILAFACLGLSGLFSRQKNGLLKGYVVAILMRGAFHTLGGYLYWMDYMPDNFPQSLAILYPIIYNYSYILAEGVITVVVLLLPPVGKALKQIRKIAVE